MAEFTLGSNTTQIIRLVPILNQDFTFVANASIKNEGMGYNSYLSTSGKEITDPFLTETQFHLYGDILSFSMNGTLFKDSLCILNDTDCQSALKDEQLFPFFLANASDSANLLGAIDGFMGLAPSSTPGMKSYGQHLKDNKLIEMDTVSF